CRRRSRSSRPSSADAPAGHRQRGHTAVAAAHFEQDLGSLRSSDALDRAGQAELTNGRAIDPEDAVTGPDAPFGRPPARDDAQDLQAIPIELHGDADAQQLELGLLAGGGWRKLDRERTHGTAVLDR